MEFGGVVQRPLMAASPDEDRSCFSASTRNGRCRAIFVAYSLLVTSIIVIPLLFWLNRPTADKNYLLFVGVLAAAILNIINTITLLVGLHKYKRGCVLLFLIMESILFIVIVVAIIATSIKSGKYTFHVVHIVVFGTTCLVIVGRYYNQMEDNDNNNVYPRAQRDTTLHL